MSAEDHKSYVSNSALETEIHRKATEALSKETGDRVSDIVPTTSTMHTGVDSSTYLRIKRKIEATLRLSSETPMSLLLNTSTVGELSRVLATELEKPRYFPVDMGDKDYDPVVTL